ncbi:hypothetical protein DERP_008988 [Dermatophagoides pteronyssinus]|uniref:Uncharacterized protein n=1 Tax=Dermatophagoides pteronyssinus TaxID=6956 RepID=A0ABQ8JGM8_DERPT|nr:hypothetical protein DERP_008988 [Dermatophagoides pteronyssinus]
MDLKPLIFEDVVVVVGLVLVKAVVIVNLKANSGRRRGRRSGHDRGVFGEFKEEEKKIRTTALQAIGHWLRLLSRRSLA